MAAPKNIHHAKCEICGADVEYRSRRRRFCKSCSEIVSKCYQKVRNAHGVERSDVAVELAQNIVDAGHETAKSKTLAHRCPYCGKSVKSDGAFCSSCRADGLDELYRFNGRSNGWDRKRPEGSEKTVGGWRGRPCDGGGMNMERKFCNFQSLRNVDF